MTSDSFNDPSDPESTQDSDLNQLLSEARWPEPDAQTLGRLQSVVDSVLADSGDSGVDEKKRFAMLAPSPSRGGGRLRIPALATAVAIALLIAFLAGRWTSQDRRGSIAGALPTDQKSNVPNSPGSVEALPESPVPDLPAAMISNVAAADSPEPKESLSSVESKTLQPQPDPLSEKRRRLTQRETMQLQLESVLACLEAGEKVDASCCQTLMPRRAEFEYLLAEMIRNTTGQRQLAAVTALGFVGTDGSVPGLLQSASSESLRSAALEAVKRCSSEKMLAALVLQSGNTIVAEEYVKELAHRSTPQAAFPWLHLVRRPESRELCLRNADDLSPALVNMLFSELDAPVIDDRMAAIVSLGRRADEPTLKRATELCWQYPLRWEPAAILIWNGSQAAMKTLTVLQQTPERYAALQTASIQLKAFIGQPSGP